MENDDQTVGQILSRRDALKVLGIGSAAFLAACASSEGTSTLVPTTGSTQVSSTKEKHSTCPTRHGAGTRSKSGDAPVLARSYTQ